MEVSFFLLFLLSFIPKIISTTTNAITTNHNITDGKTIVSSGGTFELGFFSPSGSSKRYLGIWYKQILPVQTVVWVANREKPLTNTSSVVLKVTKPGILALLNDKNESIWSTNTSRSVQHPVALLLDSGNLVVKDANDDNTDKFLWQSFNFPTDTFLPNMKLGMNFLSGQEVYFSAWKNNSDPTPGEITLHIDPTGYPQTVVKSGTSVLVSSGPWNGLRWSGDRVPPPNQSSIYRIQFVFNKEEVSYSYYIINNLGLLRLVLDSSGYVQGLMWVNQTRSWLNVNLPPNICDRYRVCGAYGSCDIDHSPVCTCLDKFVAKYPQQWEKGDWSKGCVRRKPIDCNKEHVFLNYSGIKLPDTTYSQYNRTMTLDNCRQACSRNCSCTAYSSLDIRNGGRGCLFWFGELVDIKKISGGQDIYIRIASSELEKNRL